MNPLDFIFPKNLYCASCGRPLPLGENEFASLCTDCVEQIVWITGRRCQKCGRPLADENPDERCHDCLAVAEHSFRRAFGCVLYTGLAAELVRGMKYRGKAWYADTLAAFMAERYFCEADPETGELPAYDFILGLPMSKRKKTIRGYDQAALIAAGLARRIGIPYLKGALIRVRETDVMSSLSADERRQNLAGAFSVRRDMIHCIAGKKLLLADDVYTTGSSADACAETLMSAGAKNVDAIVFATGADVRRTEDCPAVAESPGQLRAKGPT